MLLVISCLSLLSFTVVTPITPGLMQHFALGSDASLGFIASSFALGRFLTTSVWPLASDYVGRKVVLCIALIGGAFSAVLQGVAISLHWPFVAFLCARGLAGMFSGIVPVMKAYIFDYFPDEEVPKVLAYREAAGTLAFVVGPAIGGVLAIRCFASPFFLSGATGILSAVLCARGLPATLRPRKARTKRVTATKAEAAEAERRQSALAILAVSLLLLSFVWACTRTCFHTYFPLLLVRRYYLEVAPTGAILTAVSLLVMVVQVCGFEPCRRCLGLRGTLGAGGLLTALGLAGLGIASRSRAPLCAFLVASAAYGAGVALSSPAMPALLGQVTPPARRGAMLGLESVVVNFGRILAPPLFGLLVYQGALEIAGAAMGLATLAAWWLSGRMHCKESIAQR